MESSWLISGVVRGHHIYKYVWIPSIGEILKLCTNRMTTTTVIPWHRTTPTSSETTVVLSSSQKRYNICYGCMAISEVGGHSCINGGSDGRLRYCFCVNSLNSHWGQRRLELNKNSTKFDTNSGMYS